MFDAPAPTATPPPPDPATRVDDTPPRFATRTPFERAVNHPVRWALVAGAAAAIGAASTPFRSIGWTLSAMVLGVALTLATARSNASRALGLGGVAFVPWLAVRMSPWLLTMNLTVATSLVLTGVTLPTGARVAVGIGSHLRRWGRGLATSPLGPVLIVRSGHRSLDRHGRWRSWLPSVVIGLATMLLALVVLASGDALLASFFDPGDIPSSFAPRTLAAGTAVLLFAFGVGATGDAREATTKAVRLPERPMLFVMIGLGAAIGVYAATQASAALLGEAYVTARTGLTFADYARSGFFQLVAISAAATLAVAAATGAADRDPSMARRLRAASVALTIGVAITVASAVAKLVIYTDRYGLTMLRLYTVVFVCWLGFVSLLALVAILRPRQRWFASAVIVTAIVGAFAMNVANPEQIVANHNIDRSTTTGELDVAYLSSLSLDAAPAILGRLAEIDAVTASPDGYEASRPGEIEPGLDARSVLTRAWCERSLGERRTGLAFNASRDAAHRRAEAVCV